MRENLVWFWKLEKKKGQDNYFLTIIPPIFSFLLILLSLRIKVLSSTIIHFQEVRVWNCCVLFAKFPQIFHFSFSQKWGSFQLERSGWAARKHGKFWFWKKIGPKRVIWFQGFDFLLFLFVQGNGSTICNFWFGYINFLILKNWSILLIYFDLPGLMMGSICDLVDNSDICKIINYQYMTFLLKWSLFVF